MSERGVRANAAVLVGLDFGADGYSESLEELRLLVESGSLKPRALIRGRRERPDTAAPFPDCAAVPGKVRG